MRSALLNFRADRSGNVAILFGILAVPLFAAAGMALDYAFAVRERTDLQNAVDAAAISLAKLPQNTSAADLKTKAEAFVAAYMPNSAANDFKIDVVPSKGRLDITATANYPTTVVRVLDLISSDASHSNMEIGASATASWGNGKVEVVLVLDNTGSMDGSKLTNLKTAANSLVDYAGHPGDGYQHGEDRPGTVLQHGAAAGRQDRLQDRQLDRQERRLADRQGDLQRHRERQALRPVQARSTPSHLAERELGGVRGEPAGSL